MVRAMDQVSRYPDPLCRRLRKRLGEHHGLPAEQILCGNGASDLIDRLALALRPKEALVTAPTFSEYAAAVTRVGCRVTAYPLRRADNFQVTEGILSWITPALDVLFSLCSPATPPGKSQTGPCWSGCLGKCGACGVLAVVDECF